MSYWDIANFLAEEQTVQFYFTEDAPQMSFIDPSKGIEGTVTSKQSLNAPIWVANTLLDYCGRELVEVDLPQIFHKKSENHIDSHRTNHRSTVEQVNLDKKSPYFFEMYVVMKKLIRDHPDKIDGVKMANLLHEKFLRIAGKASVWQQEGKSQPLSSTYTRLQMELYQMIKRRQDEYDAWMYRLRDKQ